ncbi:MAG TPA: hypothetical protein DCS59_01975 [Eubacterium sp.]|nr:hypothetical protein [Eubacterium sp.]
MKMESAELLRDARDGLRSSFFHFYSDRYGGAGAESKPPSGVSAGRKKWYNRNVNREKGEMVGKREGEGRLEEGRIV